MSVGTLGGSCDGRLLNACLEARGTLGDIAQLGFAAREGRLRCDESLRGFLAGAQRTVRASDGGLQLGHLGEGPVALPRDLVEL